MSERRLATVERISAVDPIPGADAIDVATVRGWQVVIRKREFSVGDLVVFIEIDTALPLEDPRFAFLAPRGSRVVDGRPHHVLRTARLRGQYSQGLVIAIDQFPEIAANAGDTPAVGADLTDVLSLSVYEPPVPVQLSGMVAGAFPTDVVGKTDSVRVQNLSDEVLTLLGESGRWEATEKLDGSSVTVINDPERGLRIATRNWELRRPATPDQATTQWRIADKLDLSSIIPTGWAVQGELFGEGIQGNPLRIQGQRLAVFAVVDSRRSPVHRGEWPQELAALAVPRFGLPFPATVAHGVAAADRLESLLAPGQRAEGIVWHEVTGRVYPELDNRSTFKVINNDYLARAK